MALRVRRPWWWFLPFLRFPPWFNGHPLGWDSLPRPEQPASAHPRDALADLPPRGGAPVAVLIPHFPPEPGFLRQLGQNAQVGAQPERQAATLAGHTVTGPYLLTGELPVGPGLKPRLTPSPELLFHPHPIRRPPERPELGPVGPIVPTGYQQ